MIITNYSLSNLNRLLEGDNNQRISGGERGGETHPVEILVPSLGQGGVEGSVEGVHSRSPWGGLHRVVDSSSLCLLQDHCEGGPVPISASDPSSGQDSSCSEEHHSGKEAHNYGVGGRFSFFSS